MQLLWSRLGGWTQTRKFGLLLLMAPPILASGQMSARNRSIVRSPLLPRMSMPQGAMRNGDTATANEAPSLGSSKDAAENSDSCYVHEVEGLPGSHEFASHFMETIASDPAPDAKDSGAIWGLTADLSDRVPEADRAMYILRSTDGGKTWTQVARVDSGYFDADIAEGLRNGLAVSPGGAEFVLTTQEGAFQIIPQSDPSHPVINSIAGPRIPHPRPLLSIPKNEGDPVRAGVVEMTADGKHMIVGYGYFDMNPQLFTYRRDGHGSWIEDGTLPHLPTDLDIFSMEFQNPGKIHPQFLYVGTGDQAFRLNLRTKKWIRVAGVGADSSIHAMTTVGGLHLAACWGVYEPVSAAAVERVTHANFLLHRAKDEVGPNIRAYGIAVDPARHNREVLTAITGVYTTRDRGRHWKRLNDLPEGEFHSAHFNPDGTVIVSGFAGTFLANPFSNACSPHLRTRTQNAFLQ